MKDEKDVPYFKLPKVFYFAGMEKSVLIPISSPSRVIVEPNGPRQGYSHLTWKGLNAYYLQNAMNYKEYTEFLGQCKSTALKVYSINRTESRFLKDSIFDKGASLSWYLGIFTCIYMFITEATEDSSDTVSTYYLLVITTIFILILSIYNFLQKPPNSIFLNYDNLLRECHKKHFNELNNLYRTKNGLRFDVANNTINWLEIYIPKHLRMPYSGY